MKNISNLLTMILLLSGLNSFSQIDGGSLGMTGSGYGTSSVTDYECLGINPANLGWQRNDHNINLCLTQGSFAIYSEPLKRALVGELFNKDLRFTPEQRSEAVENFTDTRLLVNFDLIGAGFSFQDEKIGGFGFNIREHLFWDSNLNQTSSDFLFNGFNSAYFDSLAVDIATGDTVGWSTNPKLVEDLFRGTSLYFNWYREYNFGYGRKVFNGENFSLHAGIGLKYLVGYSIFNYSYTSSGDLVAYSAMNPMFDIDYDKKSPSSIEGTDYQPVGSGFGFDLGLTAEVQKKIRIGAAINNIGSIKWDGNVYEGKSELLENIETGGMNNYNIFEEGQNIAAENTEWGEWTGLASKKVDLPMNFRAGAEYKLNEKIRVGGDLFIPMNEVPGSHNKLIGGLGGHVETVKWLQLSAGVVTGGNFGVSIPFGFVLLPLKNEKITWEIGMAVGDITSYFQQTKPTVSFAFGFFRFSFGNFLNREPGVEAQ